MKIIGLRQKKTIFDINLTSPVLQKEREEEKNSVLKVMTNN